MLVLVLDAPAFRMKLEAETDLRPFQLETTDFAVGSWKEGTKFALARGISTLCSTRAKLRKGDLNLRLSAAYWDETK